jgi:hypothetical protein
MSTINSTIATANKLSNFATFLSTVMSTYNTTVDKAFFSA